MKKATSKVKKAKAPAQMTREEYMDEGGNVCPFCRSRNISGGDFQADCDYAWRDVECDDCDGVWVEDFKMVNYEAKYNPKGEVK